MLAHLAFLAPLVAHLPGATPAAPPDAMTLAQAQDRCMATYAVRLTRTGAADEEIFVRASEGCRQLAEQLDAAIGREYPPNRARQLRASLDAGRRPNFLAMLQRIRADRQRRPGS